MKSLKSSVDGEQAGMKKSGRAVEVLTAQLRALEERVGELERVRREAGDRMDRNHLRKLERQVEVFRKGWWGREIGRAHV